MPARIVASAERVESVSMLYGTPIEHGEFSTADDPRVVRKN